jgi:hypothetical protein
MNPRQLYFDYIIFVVAVYGSMNFPFEIISKTIIFLEMHTYPTIEFMHTLTVFILGSKLVISLSFEIIYQGIVEIQKLMK